MFIFSILGLLLIQNQESKYVYLLVQVCFNSFIAKEHLIRSCSQCYNNTILYIEHNCTKIENISGVCFNGETNKCSHSTWQVNSFIYYQSLIFFVDIPSVRNIMTILTYRQLVLFWIIMVQISIVNGTIYCYHISVMMSPINNHL